MFEKIKQLEQEYQQLENDLSSQEVLSDPKRLRETTRRHAELQPIVREYHNLQNIVQQIEENQALLQQEKDSEMRTYLEEELESNKRKKEARENRLQKLLVPKDPNDGKDVLVEIRAGTGGEEASLFAAELYRMYHRYAELKGWKTEPIEINESEIGGFKEAIFSVSGDDAYKILKFESGTHRVQRVPVTESGGRIHTSAVTVAVLPEAEEADVDINQNDLRFDVFRSSGPGGQSVNTTDSAVRITHIPSGMVVSCQDEKSQSKNKAKAMRVLRARLLEQAEQEKNAEIAQSRKNQVGTGDRSERIRTYNFPQGRVTDHRIGLTLYNLEAALQGEIDEISQKLVEHELQDKLSAQA